MFIYRVLSVMLLVLSLAFVACEKDEEKDPRGGQEAVCLDQCGGEEAGAEAGQEQAGSQAGEEVEAGAQAGQSAGEESQAGQEAAGEEAPLAGEVVLPESGEEVPVEDPSCEPSEDSEDDCDDNVEPESGDMGSASEESDMGV